ncbi:hypothetical protein LAZ67_1007072 [Cordylochernes scorpioides]|uniref:Uncharacterized protein n=1 Tax=Cordylochernes scorpioides TaxID=51811 RepID=A0ABY6K0V9_9ARAC|nr:hypothetical protein LAZ67_1007072 [Cordylochernes scorpioides]
MCPAPSPGLTCVTTNSRDTTQTFHFGWLSTPSHIVTILPRDVLPEPPTAVRSLFREVFVFFEFLLELQAWLFAIGLHPEAMKLTKVAKATIYVRSKEEVLISIPLFFSLERRESTDRANKLPIEENNVGFTKFEPRRKRPVDSEAACRENKMDCVQAAAVKPTLNQRLMPKSKIQEFTTIRQKKATLRARSEVGKLEQCVYLEFCPDFRQA